MSSLSPIIKEGEGNEKANIYNVWPNAAITINPTLQPGWTTAKLSWHNGLW